MSENSSTENSGTERVGTERGAHKGAFPTLEAAQQVKPPSDKFRVYIVTDPSGKEVYSWGFTADGALNNAARSDGYTARVADPKGGGQLTKERVAAKLADFTDEELAGMGLSRRKAKK